jgi:hypothetical protein
MKQPSPSTANKRGRPKSSTRVPVTTAIEEALKIQVDALAALRGIAWSDIFNTALRDYLSKLTGPEKQAVAMFMRARQEHDK